MRTKDPRTRHQGLVWKMAYRYEPLLPPALEVGDLVQIGYFAVQHAMENYDASKGYTEGTYAVRWIRQYMVRAIVTGEVVRDKKAGRMPSCNRCSKRHKCPVDPAMRKPQCNGCLFTRVSGVSMDTPLTDGYEFTMHDTMPSAEPQPDSGVMHSESVALVYAELNTMPERTRNIVIGYGRDDNTLESLSKMYGITRERVRQIWDGARQRLKRRLIRAMR